MEDGYWDALLRDNEIEETRAAPRGATETEDEIGPFDTMPPVGDRRPRAIGNTLQEEEADWTRAQELLASGELLALEITSYNRGGLLTDFGSIQGFLPASHLLNPPAVQAPPARMNALAMRIGETLRLRIIEIDRERRRLILSERCAQNGDRVSELMSSIQPGQVFRGKVTNLCAFGAFVDLGGFEGLIHISELSWGRVNTPDEVTRPGEDVEVIVLEVNVPAQKIALSLKQMRPNPWHGIENRYHVGQVVEGVITNVVNFGAFARLEEGLEGLIHISELAEGSFMHPRNVVNEGDRVRVRVLHVDGSHHRLALTMRSSDASARERFATPPLSTLLR